MRRGRWSLEYPLDFNGEVIVYEQGFTARFRITRTDVSAERPHGISYSLTFHDPSGRRIVGFDNAHGISDKGGRRARVLAAHDHWHRDESDQGRLYRFVNGEKLIEDFFNEIERILRERGIWQEER